MGRGHRHPPTTDYQAPAQDSYPRRLDWRQRQLHPELYDLLDRCYTDDWDATTGTLQVYASNWREVQPGIIDREVVAWYTHGNCAVLAIELHRLSGWPLVLLTSDKTDVANMNDTPMVHVLAQRPDGQLIDIAGPHTPQEALHAWQHRFPDIRLQPVADEQALLDVIGDDFSMYDELERALTRDYAHRLHAMYQCQ